MNNSGEIFKAGPVLVTVPHAGRAYPAEFATRVRLPAAALRPLEDRYADLLVRDAEAAGFATLIAQTPRCWIDLNRRETDIDDKLIMLPPGFRGGTGLKVRAGLGLVPRRVMPGGDIWRTRITLEDVEHRIATIHRPWHAAIAELLIRARKDYACALLVDLHSMPTPPGRDAPHIVIGDLFGQSASSRYSQLALSVARAHGFRCALNLPYAGGHTLERHGAPRLNVHAIQVEIDKSLYLDRDYAQPRDSIRAVQAFVADLAQALAEEAIAQALPLAAE